MAIRRQAVPLAGGPCYRQSMDRQLDFLRLVMDRLEGAGIRCMLTGSLAQAVYATPRMTRDIDIVIEVERSDVARLVGLFAADCIIEEAAVREAVTRRGMVNIIHTQWVVKADLIVRKDSAYRRLELSRRRRMDVGGTGIAVVSPEDLILSKLVWAEGSRSELQRRDVADLIESVEALDWEYLRTWAADLGVGDALRELAGPDGTGGVT